MTLTAVNTDPSFAITATGHAFKILSDGLYSDKIAAVIRELGCNAYDSHIAAGKPNTLFKVTLPCSNDPYFSVQDFGLGISDADIYNIYTKYFTSTKSANTQLIGELGLGSKSPFSLVREFFVESNYNGTYRKYRMYIDTTATPRVAMIDHKTTSEPNGVKVSFRPNDDDIEHFNYKAITVFKWFATTPIVTCNGVVVEIDNLNKNMNLLGWYKRESKSSYNNEPALAIMGNIAYPLIADSIKGISIEAKYLLALPLVIQFDMGSFEVSASRESVGYDDRSCENIRNRLQQILEEYYNDIFTRVSSATSEWNARIIYTKAFNDLHGWGFSLKTALKNRKFYWNGIEIDSKSITLKLKDIYSGDVSLSAIRTGGTSDHALHRLKKGDTNIFIQECATKNVIVYDDVERNGANRIKFWLAEQKKLSLSKYFDITVFEKPTSGIGWKGLSKLLGNPEVVYVSKLPAPPKKAKEASSSETMLKFDVINKKFVPVDYNHKLGGFYIDHLSKSPVDKTKRSLDLRDILTYSKALNFIPQDTVIYAAKGYLRGKITRSRNWTNIIDFLHKKIESQMLKFTDDINILATKHDIDTLNYKISNSGLYSYNWNFRDPNSKMKEFMETHREFNAIVNKANNNNTLSTFLSLLGELRIPKPFGSADPRVKAFAAEFVTRYPMLSLINADHWRRNFNKINEYVDMVDVAWVYFELTRSVKEEEEEI